MKELENLKELYLEEIKKINKKGELTPVDAEAAKKALEAIEKINEICESYNDDEGYSERRYPMRSMNRNNRSYDNGRYSEGMRYMPNHYMYRDSMMPEMNDGYYNDWNTRSDRRGRSSTTGRYISRNHETTVDHMIQKLEKMKMDAPSDATRMAIDRAIDELEAY